jgi:hypothetical protein
VSSWSCFDRQGQDPQGGGGTDRNVVRSGCQYSAKARGRRSGRREAKMKEKNVEVKKKEEKNVEVKKKVCSIARTPGSRSEPSADAAVAVPKIFSSAGENHALKAAEERGSGFGTGFPESF